MHHNSSGCMCLSLVDAIDELGLSIRSYNALRRAGIRTVGQLVQTIDAGCLPAVRNVGQKAIDEIESCLARVRFVDAEQPADVPDGVTSSSIVSRSTDVASENAQHQAMAEATVPKRVLRWQGALIEKQIRAGLLHEKALVSGNTVGYWLSAIDKVDRDQAYETMAYILGGSINICEELSFLLKQIPRNYVRVLLSRYGFMRETCEEVGAEMGVTRSRVSQIGVTLKEKIRGSVVLALKASKLTEGGKMVPSLLRMQSALIIAKDMGMDITYIDWKERIRASGLLGEWASRDFADIAPVEALFAVCRTFSHARIRILEIPDNLKYAVELAASGTPDLPAKIVHSKVTVPRAARKLIDRHARHCGGVHARWLSEEIGMGLARVKETLHALGYQAVSRDWFVPTVPHDNYVLSVNDVLHHALRKMFQYCRRLSINDVCSGIRHTVYRTSFPVPSPDVMDRILRMFGYESEDGLYWWSGDADEELSTGEMVIMNCLDENGPVVHHSELAQAFVDSELSFPSLHATLNRSPLFDRMGTGLYRMRGRSVTKEDVERAEAAGERIPVDPEVEYDKSGRIRVSATVSTIAVGTGVVLCEQFPNLSGEWDCFVQGKRCGKLDATESEFRHLSKAFRLLDCRTGDRLKFTFNAWDRTVGIEKAGD